MSGFGLSPEPDETPTEEQKPTLATDLLAGLRGGRTKRPPISLTESDKLAQEIGFTSREPGSKVSYSRPTRKRQKRAVEFTFALNMRVRESLLNRFIAYCDEKALSYPEALEQLMNEASGVKEG